MWAISNECSQQQFPFSILHKSIVIRLCKKTETLTRWIIVYQNPCTRYTQDLHDFHIHNVGGEAGAESV
jgi:hypothetical protein